MIACWPTLIKSPNCATTAARQVKLHVALMVGWPTVPARVSNHCSGWIPQLHVMWFEWLYGMVVPVQISLLACLKVAVEPNKLKVEHTGTLWLFCWKTYKGSVIWVIQDVIQDFCICPQPLASLLIWPKAPSYNVVNGVHTDKRPSDITTWREMVAIYGAETENSIKQFITLCWKKYCWSKASDVHRQMDQEVKLQLWNKYTRAAFACNMEKVLDARWKLILRCQCHHY